jgi:peptidoglycan/xylan/chitin deacetylase (PgdA/CDA1 family)
MRISWSVGSWRPVVKTLADRGAVAITIDDGPMPETFPDLLGLLDAYAAKATFFISGCRATRAETLVADAVARGHAVYAHGWEHVRVDEVGAARMCAAMARCEALLSRHRPTPQPYLVRLPYNAGYRNPAVHRALARWQPRCQIAHWGPSSEDHRIAERCQDRADVERECAREVARVMADPRLPGGVILMHDQPIGDGPGAALKPEVTRVLLRRLLEALSRAGLRMVTLAPLASQRWWQRVLLV